MNISWVGLALCSALFLGLYDLAKKAAIKNNAIPAVLFWSIVAGALPWIPWILWSYIDPDTVPWEILRVAVLSPREHGLLLTKAILVGGSWAFAYQALQNLPLSIASPIRATSPLWTILVATLLLGERPSLMQWLGVLVILASFYAFSFVGKWEGIDFRRDRHVGCMVIAAVLASASALYDKFLLQNAGLEPSTVQAWFSVDLILVTAPWFVAWWRQDPQRRAPFQWRASIPAIGLLLLVTDFLYFSAVHRPDALISLVSPLRSTSVLVSLVAGVHLYKEQNLRPKAICVLGLLGGVFLVSQGR